MTEVIERLTKLSKVGFGYDINPEDREALQAAVAALSASPAGLVKPLEWVEHWGGANDDLPSWRGKNPLGLHVSVDFIGKYKLDRHSDAPQDELDAAKDAAFADYSARIMSAIEPAGVGVETPPPSTHVAVPQDVIDLVIAAREFWDDKNDLSDEAKALDRALEAFSSRVPYENEPENDR